MKIIEYLKSYFFGKEKHASILPNSNLLHWGFYAHSGMMFRIDGGNTCGGCSYFDPIMGTNKGVCLKCKAPAITLIVPKLDRRDCATGAKRWHMVIVGPRFRMVHARHLQE